MEGFKRNRIVIAVAVVLVVGVAGIGVGYAAGAFEPEIVRTAPEDILVSPAWVRDNAGNITILDVGRDGDAFAEGHIPGAAYVDRVVVWDRANGIDGMLPDPEVVAADLAESGVSNDRPVVVYDGGNGLWASRFFWALEYLGHEHVHLLDGGIAAWNESGFSLTDEINVPDRGDFVADVRPQLIADKEFILEQHGNENFAVLDARSEAEYSGQDVRAARGGHIPGSVNIDWVNNLSESNRFRPFEELAGLYGDVLEGHDGPAVTLCQTGVRGAHTYVVLRVLGEEDVRVYDGSWAEWGNDENAPVSGGA